jgi:hypothetical protein
MKKTTTAECEQIGVSIIVRTQKHHLFKLKPKWLRHEFNSMVAQRLENISLYSLTHNNPLKLDFTYTTPYWGGMRYWLVCPDCKRRVGKLYRPNFERMFRCRSCYGLAYTSSQKHNHRVNLLIKKLKGMAEGEALIQVTTNLQKTTRGFRLLQRVHEKMHGSFPPLSWLQSEHETEMYEKYIKVVL